MSDLDTLLLDVRHAAEAEGPEVLADFETFSQRLAAERERMHDPEGQAACEQQIAEAVRIWVGRRSPERSEKLPRDRCVVVLDPSAAAEFTREAARLDDAIEASHGHRAVLAELAGIPWFQAQWFGPSFPARKEP